MPGYWFDDTGGAPPSYGAGHPSNDPEPSGGNGGGQGPHWDSPSPPPLPNTPPPGWTPDPIATIEEVTSPVVVDTSGGDDPSGFTSDTTTNPYYTTAGTMIPEQRPLQAPSDFLMGNVIADVLATNPGYASSWDYNPSNPDNLIGQSPTLGSIMAVNQSGEPILDSSGNPIFTEMGQSLIDHVQSQYDPNNPVDITLPGAFEQNIATLGDLNTFIDDYHRSFDDWWHDDPGTPWDQQWYDYSGGGDEDTIMAQLGTWGAKPVPTEMAAMGEMQPIYGAEFGEELMASPLFMAGMEDVTGIPYRGRPEFGTIEMDVV